MTKLEAAKIIVEQCGDCSGAIVVYCDDCPAFIDGGNCHVSCDNYYDTVEWFEKYICKGVKNES